MEAFKQKRTQPNLVVIRVTVVYKMVHGMLYYYFCVWALSYFLSYGLIYES